nr:uncharacterized protein LOC132782767 [Anolis sagrei ordinatus]
MEQKARASQGKGKGKGIHWRFHEIKDLLDLWGEKEVQDALRAVHKNIDVFEGIAKQMRERGHSRTAEECRYKTKTMRLEYKRVQAHNKCSENAPKTCSFYTELENILKRDAITDPPRLSRSYPVRREELPLGQDLDATTLDETCSRESILDTQATGPSLFTVEELEDNDEDSKLLLLEVPEGEVYEPVSVHAPPALLGSPPVTPMTTKAESEGEPETPNQSQQSPEQERESPPAKAAPSPGTHLRNLRTRRQRGRRGENIALAIMQHADEQAKLQREAMREDTSKNRQILLSLFHYLEEDTRASQERFNAIETMIRDVLDQSRVEKQCCTHCANCCNKSGPPPKRPFHGGIPPPSQTDLDMASTSADCHEQPLPEHFREVSQGEISPSNNPVTADITEPASASLRVAEAQKMMDTEGTRKGERERKTTTPYSP